MRKLDAHIIIPKSTESLLNFIVARPISHAMNATKNMVVTNLLSGLRRNSMKKQYCAGNVDMS